MGSTVNGAISQVLPSTLPTSIQNALGSALPGSLSSALGGNVGSLLGSSGVSPQGVSQITSNLDNELSPSLQNSIPSQLSSSGLSSSMGGSLGSGLGTVFSAASALSGGTTVTLGPLTFTTTYSNSGPGTFSSSQGATSTTSPTSSVYQFNLMNAPSFLTCPQSASGHTNPTDDFYFYANKGSYVAGDECLVTDNQLTTTLSLSTAVQFISSQGPAPGLAWSTVNPLQVTNPGVLTTAEISYSPTVDGVLSNGFATNSYIFKGVPSMAQHAIWSWNLEFADFNDNAPKGKSQSFSQSLQFLLGPCLYGYTYSENTTLNSVSNNYIPFSEVTSNGGGSSSTGSSGGSGSGGIGTLGTGTGGISISGIQRDAGRNATGLVKAAATVFNELGTVFQAASGSSSGASCPSGGVLSQAQLDACAQNAGFSDSASSPQGLDNVVAISQAESSGNTQAIHNNGGTCTSGANAGQPNVDVGIMQINNCAHPDEVSCSGTSFGSCSGCATDPTCSYQAAYQISNDGTNFNAWCTYGPSACGGNGNSAYCKYLPSGDTCAGGGTGGGAVGSSGSGTSQATGSLGQSISTTIIQTLVYPYLFYNYTLNMSSSISTTNPNLTGMSEDIYSPWNYYTPANSEDQFPIDLPSVFFANVSNSNSGGLGSGSKYLLASIPQNGISINTAATPVPVGNYQSASGSSQPSYTGGKSGVLNSVLGSSSAGSGSGQSQTLSAMPIGNPISLAASANNYLYALYQDSSGNYDIAVIRLYPHGYYNGTNVQPPAAMTNAVNCNSGSTSSCDSAWSKVWGNYFAQVIQEQDNLAYVVQVIPLSALVSNGLAGGNGGMLGTGSLIQQALPKSQNESVIETFQQATSAVQCVPTLPGNPTAKSPSGDINGGQCYTSPPSESDVCQPEGQCQVSQDMQCPCTSANSCSGSTTGYGYTYYCVPTTGSTSSSVTITINNNVITYPSTTTVHASCTPVTDQCDIDSPLGTHLASGTGQASYTTPAAQAAGTYTYYVNDLVTGNTGSVVLTINPGQSGQCASPSGIANHAVTFTCQFQPYNISADDNGDIFIIGGLTGVASQTELVKISNVIIGGSICQGISNCDLFSGSSTSSSGSVAYTEIAAAPQLGNVYVASPNFGQVAVFSGSTLAYLNSIPLTYGFYNTIATSVPTLGSSTTATPIATLDIAYWLQNGGLLGTTVSGVSASTSISSQTDADLDQATYHHPISMADINGYLYVLDDWTGSLDSGSKFNILVLRAINSTGSDVQINPSVFNDVFSQGTCVVPNGNPNINNNQCYTGGSNVPPSNACSASCTPAPNTSAACGGYSVVGSGEFGTVAPGGYQYTCVSSAQSLSTTYYGIASSNLFPKNVYPPYGWILSATAGGTSLCSTCSTQAHGSYIAVGPMLSSQPPCTSLGSKIAGFFTGCGGGIGMSVDANGTVALLFPSSNGNFANSELLLARFDAENYTKVVQGTPIYQCYTAQGGGLCGQYSGLSNMNPPIFAFGDPFEYLENQGSQKIFSYANQFYSEFTGGSGSPTSAIGQSSTCASPFGSFPAPGPCSSGQSTSVSISSVIGTAPTGTVQQTAYSATNVPILQGIVSGRAYVGYKYSYTLTQDWKNFHLESGPTSCSPTIPNYPESSVSTTVYSYTQTFPATSAPMTANVEGGDTYLKYQGAGNNYYVQNLSDYGLYLSQHILFNVSSNRELGDVYVAEAGPSSDNYLILNATQQLQYAINTYSEGGSQFESVSSSQMGPNYGTQYAFGTSAPAGSMPANLIFQQTLSQPPHFGSVILFNWYKQNVWESPMYLYAPQLLGYQRIMYALNDRFDNTIFVPIDADVAHITSLSLNVNTNVSTTNYNQTTLQISGSTGEYAYNGFNSVTINFIPLSGASVYLYYGHDMNYVDSSGNPLSAQNAQLCAFGSPSSPYLTGTYPSACNPANPEWQGFQSGAGTVNYATQYASGGACSPPPNSLLYGTKYTCDIYGNQLSATCPSGANGGQAYCYPLSSNGLGVCTTQLGLMGIATTNTLGAFTFNTVACGIGQVTIAAAYYGDSLQPITITQSSLLSSANTLIPGAQDVPGTFNGVNYYWIPNQTAAVAEIGLFELSFGEIGAIALLAAAAAALLILFYRGSSGRKRLRRSS